MLFLYGLFHEATSTSDYSASNLMTVTEQKYEVFGKKSQWTYFMHPRGIFLQSDKTWETSVLLTSYPKFELALP